MLDSNMLTYFHDALAPAFDPTANPCDALVAQKVALVRIAFYWNGSGWIVPTVAAEYERIRRSDRRESHDVVALVFFQDAIELDTHEIESLKAKFRTFHSGEADCQIVAEAIATGGDVLLTHDLNLRRHLASHVQGLEFMDACEFWTRLDIPKGAKPRLEPRPGNTLRENRWWVW